MAKVLRIFSIAVVAIFLSGSFALSAETLSEKPAENAESRGDFSERARISLEKRKFDSLEGRTQMQLSGGIGYSTYSQFNWDLSLDGFYYLTSHFALGAGVDTFNNGQSNYLSVGPGFEYFIPVSDRGQIIFQGLSRYSTSTYSSSAVSATARAGYRYFLNKNIALSATLNQTWQKSLSGSQNVNAGDIGLRFGFSIFF